MTKTTYPEPTLDQVMYPSAWELLSRLASTSTRLREGAKEHRASREASTLYALGLCTNPDGATWKITSAGFDALLERA